VSDSNDTETADVVFINGDFAVPPTVRVKVIGSRISVSVGEAPHSFTFVVSRALAERFGEDLDDAIAQLCEDVSPFGPVRTFNLKFNDEDRTANLTLVKE
jgi:hypothetical protein